MTRIGAPAITDEYGERFGAAWGVVSDQVAHRLRQKGFDPSAADDALQEAAARALARRVAFADADDLARWVWTVAWRSAIDASRRHRRIVLGRQPETASPVELEQVVFHRLAIDRVVDALPTLHQGERDALFADVDRPRHADRRAAVREAVRRFRARAKLAALVEGLLGVLGWLARGSRVGLRRLRTVTGFTATGAVAVSAFVIIGLVPRAPTSALGPAPPRSTDVSHAGPTAGLPPARPATAGTTGAARARTSTDAPAQRAPYARASVPGPAGGEAFVAVRPDGPDHHLACTDYQLTGNHCVDYPPPFDRPLPVPLP